MGLFRRWASKGRKADFEMPSGEGHPGYPDDMLLREGESSGDSLSRQLAHASTPEERREILIEHLINHPDELEKESAEVSKLLNKGDREGFIEFVLRTVPERAAAKASAIRAGK